MTKCAASNQDLATSSKIFLKTVGGAGYVFQWVSSGWTTGIYELKSSEILGPNLSSLIHSIEFRCNWYCVHVL